MSKNFEPTDKSLFKFFSQSGRFQIPNYQRQYSWTKDNVEQLWEDLWNDYLDFKNNSNSDKTTFLGSVILVGNSKNSKAPLDIVDGQQRITTLTILFSVLCAKLENIDICFDEEDYDLSDLKKCIYDKTEEGKERLIIKNKSQNESDFKRTIIECEDFSKYKIFERDRDIKSEIERYENTAAIFNDKLKDLIEDHSLLKQFINYLLNNVVIIEIVCIDRNYAIRLFQVLNDRGLDLSAADILKSFLMQRLDEDGESSFISDWNACEKSVSQANITMTDVFTSYLYFSIAKNPKHSVNQELEVVFQSLIDSGKTANDIIADIKIYTDYYTNNVVTAKMVDNEYKLSILSLHWGSYQSTILTTLDYMVDTKKAYSESEKTDIICEIRRYLLLNFIAEKTLTNIKSVVFNLISSLKEKEPASKIVSDLRKKADEDLIERVVSNLASDQEVYSAKWLRPLLIALEYNEAESNKDGLYTIILPSEINKEHIMPQNFKNVEGWNYMWDVGDKYLNTLGNMTLLTETKNKQQQDDAFDKKMDKYKNGGAQKYAITNLIRDDFYSGTYNGQWNEEAIKNRYNWYCDKISEMLDIPKLLDKKFDM